MHFVAELRIDASAGAQAADFPIYIASTDHYLEARGCHSEQLQQTGNAKAAVHNLAPAPPFPTRAATLAKTASNIGAAVLHCG